MSDFALSRRIAWDIETTGLDWRREKIGTCQLFAEAVGAVVVSVGEDRPSALARLIEDNTVEKVFHHAPFDLRFMVSALAGVAGSDPRHESGVENPGSGGAE